MMMLCLVQISLLFAVGVFGGIRVKTKQGILEGQELELVTGDGTFYSFKGVRFAQAPVRELRFKEPQPPLPWQGVRNATEHGDRCYQYDFYTSSIPKDSSEDCLFLNVYTPPKLNPHKKYPVMVFIHGGGFISGSGNTNYYSPDFLVPHGVILVTINYRLEVLGFLSLENDDVPGNNGLKDQVAALKWVKENIASFGGNSSNVLLFGQSAGAASVTFHMISPLSAGLFSKVILHSGSFFSEWSLVDFPRKRAFMLGASLGLNTTNDSELLEYLRSVPEKELILKTMPLSQYESSLTLAQINYFGPVVEPLGKNRVITMAPEKYLTSKSIKDFDIITGITSEEGIFAYTFFKNQYDVFNNYTEAFVPRRLHAKIRSKEQQLKVGGLIKEHYLGNKIASPGTIIELVKYFSWVSFKYNTQRFIRKLPKLKKPVYQYLFNAVTERNYNSKLYGPNITVKGASHSDDLPYIMDAPVGGMTVNKCAESYQVIQRMSSMWTNFAKFGNPTPDRSLGVIWKPWTHSAQDYLEIGLKELVSGNALESSEYQFWDNIISKVIGDDPY